MCARSTINKIPVYNFRSTWLRALWFGNFTDNELEFCSCKIYTDTDEHSKYVRSYNSYPPNPHSHQKTNKPENTKQWKIQQTPTKQSRTKTGQDARAFKICPRSLLTSPHPHSHQLTNMRTPNTKKNTTDTHPATT